MAMHSDAPRCPYPSSRLPSRLFRADDVASAPEQKTTARSCRRGSVHRARNLPLMAAKINRANDGDNVGPVVLIQRISAFIFSHWGRRRTWRFA
ncbi:hypothetical protein FA95DRAFT_1562988 [Auriscalpium vulgare]|uniref:Uncharacterized protein n=1 Tax=Auriscalpium vulgare TaxID=40419 RepID=A0ACB8RJA9_9AGAM|nr:hypothetical protein FA95DRAFT_1562988 [Auriscalpium vulgare]